MYVAENEVQGAAARSCRCWPCRWSPCSAAWRWPSTSVAWRWPRRNARMRPIWRPLPACGRSTPAAAPIRRRPPPTRKNAAIANPILGKTLTASEIAVTHGAYHYNPTSQTFAPQFPPSGERQLRPHPGDDHAPGAAACSPRSSGSSSTTVDRHGHRGLPARATWPSCWTTRAR